MTTFVCPACHTSETRPTVTVDLGDGDKVEVHEDCYREIELIREGKSHETKA